MRICLLTIIKIGALSDRNLYADLARALVAAGHHVTVASPVERRDPSARAHIVRHPDHTIVTYRTLNSQKSTPVEKVMSLLSIGRLAARAVLPELRREGCDLLLYATPPVTFHYAVRRIRAVTGARTFLMLKDIFPQNAVDLGMTTPRSLFYRYCRRVERKLYRVSDGIGTMSPANSAYLLAHEPELAGADVSVFPNTAEPSPEAADGGAAERLRSRLGFDPGATVFVYGGNLGRPQGIPFLIEVLQEVREDPRVAVVIAGSGTEYPRLRAYVDATAPPQVRLFDSLPRAEYDELVAGAQVGLIALDHRFTIPNYPSRLLGYLDAAKPVFCITDANTDIGAEAEARGYGWAETSPNGAVVAARLRAIARLSPEELAAYGRRGRAYFTRELSSERSVALLEDFYERSHAGD